jgi:hypothetical protein
MFVKPIITTHGKKNATGSFLDFFGVAIHSGARQ